MDQKNWLWRKKSSEKRIIANDKADLSVKDNDEEVQILQNEKEKVLEESVRSLDEKLASALDECNAKDELVTKFTKMAEEAIAAHKKAEAEIMCLKEELEESTKQREAANGRLTHLNSALKDCMQKLTFTREETDQRVCDAVMRTSEEFEKAHNMLEDKLVETNKKVTNLTVENSHLSKVLLVKGKIIEDLTESNSQAEAELNALMSRLDSAEKENAFLRYEFRMLETELHNRNEEMEFIRRSADTSHKQQLENVKKIKRLEAETQRLRVLVRKRMPGQSQSVLTKLKKEIELEERNRIETRRNTNPTYLGNNDPDILRKEISFLVENLCNVEEENKNLKLVLAQKGHSGKAWDQPEELSRAKGSKELAVYGPISNDISSISSHEMKKEHESVSSESWACALISELEHFKNHKDQKSNSEQKTIGVSEMRLMDDFVEMEKLAIVAMDAPLGSSQASPEVTLTLSDEHENHVDSTGKELVQVKQGDLGDLGQEKGKGDWIEPVLKVIIEQSSVSKRDFYELLEDVRVAWHNLNFPHTSEGNKSVSSMQPISGYLAWRSPVTSPKADSISSPVINSSVSKIVELVTRFSEGCNMVETETREPIIANDYLLHVFRWRNPELKTVLQQFLHICCSLLDGKINFVEFSVGLTATLDWIMNNCMCYQGSSIRDEFIKHFGPRGLGTATDTRALQDFMFEMEKIHSIIQAENEGLKAELNVSRSSQKDLEDKNEALASDLQQSQRSIESLHTEIETLKESNRMMEDMIENQKSINEDLDTQLTVNRVKLNESLLKMSSLEVELEDKSHCFEDLEGTCLELQLQLESINSTKIPDENMEKERQIQQTGWEITAASMKLAECQETILNLGRQLKALTLSEEEPVVVDRQLCPSPSNNKAVKHHVSLLDQMLFEDGTKKGTLKSPTKKDALNIPIADTLSVAQPNSCNAICASKVTPSGSYRGLNNGSKNAKPGTLVILSGRKQGGGMGFLRKLLLRKKKKGSHKKTSYSLAV
ncbi:PREDICTED: filament-like plant protein 7 isoform X2 [Ipomoea nil]|uniref:filament-like plant protein 7 isoform X2 n=1 Tax=Ipomoea nil TaxID=35883 RepID=UPI000901AFC8|nr:PREDICTED: filament-like plant protein 7 isoform X2 [Ipomoea nil]